MKHVKSPPDLIEYFHKISPVDSYIKARVMFGYPALFFRGNLFMGLHGSSMILRLNKPERDAFVKKGAKIFEPMRGHQMKEYMVVPEQILRKPESLKPWIKKSLAYISSLPAKVKKSKKIKQ